MAQRWNDIAAAYAFSPAFTPSQTPLISVNLSETDAARKLLQAVLLGVPACDVTPKFEKPPSSATDLPEPVFNRTRDLIHRMKRESEQNPELREAGWTPILYSWETYFGAAVTELDFAHLVWSDKYCRNFLLVGLFGHTSCRDCQQHLYYEDYNTLLIQQTQKFLNLLHYLPLPNSLGFVRSTYTTFTSPLWTVDFLSGLSSSSSRPLPRNATDSPPILHLTSSRSDLLPSFHERDLRSLDSLIRLAGPTIFKKDEKDQNWRTNSIQKRKLVLAKPGEETTLAFNPIYLDDENLKKPIDRDCAGCGELFELEKLRKCGGCYLTLYCGEKCQTRHWPTHKVMCQFGKD